MGKRKHLPATLVLDFDRDARENSHESSNALITLTRAGVRFSIAWAEAWQRLAFYDEDGRVFRGLGNIQHYIEEYGARKAKKAG